MTKSDLKTLELATSKVTYELLKKLPIGDSVELGNGYYLIHQEYDYVDLDEDDCEDESYFVIYSDEIGDDILSVQYESRDSNSVEFTDIYGIF